MGSGRPSTGRDATRFRRLLTGSPTRVHRWSGPAGPAGQRGGSFGTFGNVTHRWAGCRGPFSARRTDRVLSGAVGASAESVEGSAGCCFRVARAESESLDIAPDTPVQVMVVNDRPDLRFEVHNTGIPPDPESLTQIFEPLARGEQAGNGTSGCHLGLGLLISNRIVNAHAGAIDARSAYARLLDDGQEHDRAQPVRSANFFALANNSSLMSIVVFIASMTHLFGLRRILAIRISMGNPTAPSGQGVSLPVRRVIAADESLADGPRRPAAGTEME